MKEKLYNYQTKETKDTEYSLISNAIFYTTIFPIKFLIIHVSTTNGMFNSLLKKHKNNLQNNIKSEKQADTISSLLITAIQKHDVETVHSLLSQRADYNATDSDGCTALKIACSGNVNSRVAQLLINNTSNRDHLGRLLAQGYPQQCWGIGGLPPKPEKYKLMISKWNKTQKLIQLRRKEISSSIRYIHDKKLLWGYPEEPISTQRAYPIVSHLKYFLSREPVEYIRRIVPLGLVGRGPPKLRLGAGSHRGQTSVIA